MRIHQGEAARAAEVKRKPALRPLFQNYAEAYLDVIANSSFAQLRASQSTLYANLAAGGAGVAYVLWRAAMEAGDVALLDHAGRWLTDTLAVARDEAAFFMPHYRSADHPGSCTSFYYGLSGLYFVQTLIADSRGAAAGRQRALAHFIANCRKTLSGELELVGGVAGCLVGATLLGQRIEDERLQRIVVELAEHLIRVADGNADAPWSQLGEGMAHGRSGVYFALLSAAANSIMVLPEWCLSSLRRFAESQPRRIHESSSDDSTGARHRWCSGSAGFTLLWVKAYQVTRDRSYLELARSAATRAYEYSGTYPDLCCGSAGRAYAVLSVSRIDPHPKWRRRATKLAEQALGSPAGSKWPFGLFKGQSGLFWLARDLLEPQGAGFPCLEALPCS